MAPNKFATMLHKKTHRISVILIYTLLEWILIILLLLNSFFSFIISKFATFFGLKPPCLWCSRLDHVLDPKSDADFCRNLLCEAHLIEVSKLAYCSTHRKLAETAGMCEDCLSSRPGQSRIDGRVSLFSIVKEMSVVSADGGLRKICEKDLKCSCCSKILCGGFYPPCLLFKPSWGLLDYAQKGSLIKGVEDCDGSTIGRCSHLSRSDCPTDGDDDGTGYGDGATDNQMLSDGSLCEGVERITDERLDYVTQRDDETGAVELEQDPSEHIAVLPSYEDNETMVQISSMEDISFQNFGPHFDKCSCDDRLIPIDLIDSMTVRNSNPSLLRESGQETKSQLQKAPGNDVENILEEKPVVHLTDEGVDNSRSPICNAMVETQSFFIFRAEDSKADFVEDVLHKDVINQAKQITLCCNDIEVEMEQRDSDAFSGFRGRYLGDSEWKSESINEREICDNDSIDELQKHKSISSLPCLQNNQPSENYNVACHSTACNEVDEEEEGTEQAMESSEDGGECSSASQPVPETESFGQGPNHHTSACSEFNDIDEEKTLETPNYSEGIHTLHKRLLFERREWGPESLDGSAMSDIDCIEGMTMDCLKSALKAERKALNALYAELEEERNASAIAANQTMAMITRLQEEKAAMQMEALQYQRMMEEQSEYDQEALQLLNELMVKREKEKQELEKELELCRKKILLYEAKAKRTRNTGGQAKILSASSRAEDSDGVSVDFNEGEDSDVLHESTQKTPVDEVMGLGAGLEGAMHLSTLDESLAEFEEERLSILEQLKALEEKLLTLDDEEERNNRMTEPLGENHNFVRGHYEICDHDVSIVENGLFDVIEIGGLQHHERRNIGPRAKQLLPLFDAVTIENEDDLHEEEEHALELQMFSFKVAAENKRLAIEEEVDHVYERLQALEAGKEFLKHCIGSLKKGDRGMELLQEILQHLRDLRSVELRVRSTSDAPS